MTTELPLSTDQALPGLEVPRGTQPAELEAAVMRSLRYMADNQLVDERHAGLMQLTLVLARAIRPGEKAYGVAQCAAQLLAAFDKLLPDQEGGGSNGIAELRAYLAGVGAAGGTPSVRDPA